MTLLCHDKVYCSTRELRDEPLPVVSDHPFFLKTSRKTPRNLTKLRHWLPLQRPVNLSDLLHGVFYHLKLLGKGSKNPAHQRYTFPASRSRIPERCYILRSYEECMFYSKVSSSSLNGFLIKAFWHSIMSICPSHNEQNTGEDLPESPFPQVSSLTP